LGCFVPDGGKKKQKVKKRKNDHQKLPAETRPKNSPRKKAHKERWKGREKVPHKGKVNQIRAHPRATNVRILGKTNCQKKKKGKNTP